MSWRDELLTLSRRFGQHWALAEPTVAIRWPDDVSPPPAAAPWLRFAVVPVDAAAVGLVADGRRLHRHAGLVTIDVFAPPREGRSRILGLADRAASILRGWTVAGLRCGTPRLALADDPEGWSRVTLTIPFDRDTLF